MRYRWFYILTAVMAALLIISCLFDGSSMLNLITLPFTLIAAFLRYLSLSGTVGNIISILLLICVGLLPFLAKAKQRWHKEDLLLALCSVTIWYALYYLINPTLRPWTLGGEVGTFILCGTVFSVLILWGILKLMNCCRMKKSDTIYHALEAFLLICAAERCCAVVPRFFGVLTSIRTIAAANTMPGLNLIPTNIFLFLGFAVAATEYILNAAAFFHGAQLVYQLRCDPYSKSSTIASEKAANLCRKALVIITATNTALNLLQILFAKHIHSLAAQLRFPVSSIAIVFALLALSSLLGKGRAIKEDNDLFI